VALQYSRVCIWASTQDLCCPLACKHVFYWVKDAGEIQNACNTKSCIQHSCHLDERVCCSAVNVCGIPRNVCNFGSCVCNLRGVEYVWIFVFPEKSQDNLLNVLYTHIFLTLLKILPTFAFHLENYKSYEVT